MIMMHVPPMERRAVLLTTLRQWDTVLTLMKASWLVAMRLGTP